jgi:hypothetical protein
VTAAFGTAVLDGSLTRPSSVPVAFWASAHPANPSVAKTTAKDRFAKDRFAKDRKDRKDRYMCFLPSFSCTS